jgi:hypothetical protein
MHSSLSGAPMTWNSLLVLVLIVLSGFADSLGFVYAAKIWQGVTSAEIQTAVWFAMTIIGVVIFSGRFFTWPRLEQIVATLVLVGLGWLLVRTGE